MPVALERQHRWRIISELKWGKRCYSCRNRPTKDHPTAQKEPSQRIQVWLISQQNPPYLSKKEKRVYFNSTIWTSHWALSPQGQPHLRLVICISRLDSSANRAYLAPLQSSWWDLWRGDGVEGERDFSISLCFKPLNKTRTETSKSFGIFEC